MSICTICNDPVHAHGWCEKHYRRWMKHGMTNLIRKQCEVAGCESPRKGKGWCTLHYARWRRTGNIELARRTATKKRCRVNGCVHDQYYTSRGWCRMHYMRWWTHGSTENRLAHLKAEKRPSLAELGWIAGFLEGEGSFVTNNGASGCEVVTAAQVQKEPLDKLRALVGGNIRHCTNRKANQSDYWQWTISGARARGLIFTVFMMLSQRRRKQALRALVARGPVSSVHPNDLTHCKLIELDA